MKSYRPEELFDERGTLRVTSPRWRRRGSPDGRQPARQWRPVAARTCGFRLSRLRGRGSEPGRHRRRRDARHRAVPARRHASQTRARRTSVSSAPTRRCRTDWTPCSRSTEPCLDRRDRPRRRHVWHGRTRAWRCSSEHQCQGWLEGYLLTGRHGLFIVYEAFIHIVDSMFNQHAKWLKTTARDCLAAPDRVAELPADVTRLAAGSQRLHASGSGLHRPRRQQEGGGRAGLSSARRQLPAVASPIIVCAAATT